MLLSAGDQVLAESNGSVLTTYFWDPTAVDAPVFRIAYNYGAGTDTQVYALTAATGDVAALVNNTAGTVVERYAYDPYGQVTYLTGSYGSRSASSYDWRYLHQGLRWDSIVDLYDNRARAYSPTLMRFLQNDPIGFMAGDANTYRYEGDGPTGGHDPSGLQVITGPPNGYEWDPDRPGLIRPIKPPTIPLPDTTDLIGVFGPSSRPPVQFRLKGRWKVCLRVNTEGIGHAWIDLVNVDTGEHHTLSQIKAGWGGQYDDNGHMIPGTGVVYTGTHWDRDLNSTPENKRTNRLTYSCEKCKIVTDPFLPAKYGFGDYNNNCASFAVYAWKDLTGEDLGNIGIAWILHDTPGGLAGKLQPQKPPQCGGAWW